ncbi:hypothetical protein AB0938_31610, partial [Streptomyces sp. NPDC047071]
MPQDYAALRPRPAPSRTRGCRPWHPALFALARSSSNAGRALAGLTRPTGIALAAAVTVTALLALRRR